MGIDLNLNDEQRLIQETAHDFFDRHSPPEKVRASENQADEFSRDLWNKMAELGWVGMPFPDDFGGLDCSILDMYGLYLELGRYLVPCPHLDTVVIGGGLVAALGNAEQKQRILPEIAAGKMIVSPAIMEPEGVFGPNGIKIAATRAGDGFVLNGTKALVPYVKSAAWLVVAARTGKAAGESGITLFLVDPGATGVTCEALPNMARYPLYAVSFADVAVTPDNVLGTVDQAWAALDDVVMKAAILQSAMIAGGGDRVLEMSADYAKERVQFGQPIGRHQAVQYLVTDIAIDVHLTKLLTLQAAWRATEGLPFKREAALAKAQASKAASVMIHRAHEVHAGIGFMNDYDLGLFTRRAKNWETNLGDYRYHLERAMAETGTEERLP